MTRPLTGGLSAFSFTKCFLGACCVHLLRLGPPFSATANCTDHRKPPFHGEHTFDIFKRIMSAKVDMPPYFHPDAQDLVRRLLVADVTQRLGGTRGGGAEEVMAHPWFAGLDWAALQRKQIRAPINPGITGEGTIYSSSARRSSPNAPPSS